MSTAQIYSQYISDYEDAAKKYNRGARAYQNALDLTSGPIKAKDSNTGQDLGLYKPNSSVPFLNFLGREGGMGRLMPSDYAVKTGTHAEYLKAMEDNAPKINQGQSGLFGSIAQVGEKIATGAGKIGGYYNPQAKERASVKNPGNAFGLGSFVENIHNPYANARDDDLVSWSEKLEKPSGNTRNIYGQYFTDVGSGYYAGLKGGVGTGQLVTNRMMVTPDEFKGMQQSGSYKDLKILENINDEWGESYLVDATYEQMRMPQRPGEFTAEKPSLSIAQLREIQNPTPTMADAEREGVNDVGLIESARNKFMSAKPGLISSSR